MTFNVFVCNLFLSLPWFFVRFNETSLRSCIRCPTQYWINGSENNKERPFLSPATFEQKLVYFNVKFLVLTHLRADEGGLPLEDSKIKKVGTVNCLLGAFRHRFFFLIKFLDAFAMDKCNYWPCVNKFINVCFIARRNGFYNLFRCSLSLYVNFLAGLCIADTNSFLTIYKTL